MSAYFSKLSGGQILGRNWDKSLNFPLCYSQSPQITDVLPPSPLGKSGLKLVCDVNILYTGTSSLRTLKSMSRNPNEIVCSGMRLLDKLSDVFCKKERFAVVSDRANLSLDERPSTLLRHFFFTSLTEQPQLFSFLPDFW
jgi:hypothetical protein